MLDACSDLFLRNNTDGGDHGVDGSEWCDNVDCGGDDSNYSSNTDGGDHGVDGSEWCDDVDCGGDDDNYGNG